MRKMDRRVFIRGLGASAAALYGGVLFGRAGDAGGDRESITLAGEASRVYMTDQITSGGLLGIYAAVGKELPGRVAIKVHTGESELSNHLRPEFIRDLVRRVGGTIVECNTAYGGNRDTTAEHLRVVSDRGFTSIADVDILDAEGEMSLPFARGRNITEDFVGSHFANYNSLLVLTHFKGHAMGGFGGALKNISIGLASRSGKCWIHSGGTSRTSPWGGAQDPFLESMAEASGAVIGSLGGHIVYINVMNNLSVDCDCNGRPSRPELEDIGILASLDPVALDRSCVDLIYAADAGRSASLRRRIESLNGTLLLTHAEELGLGSQQYNLLMLNGNDSGISDTPSSSSYTVHLSHSGDYLHVLGDFTHFSILDISGRIMGSTSERIFRVSSFPRGIYLLRITAEDRGAITRKIRI